MRKYIGYYNTNLIIKTRNAKPLNNKNNNHIVGLNKMITKQQEQ